MRVIRLAAIFILLHAVLAVSVDQRNQRNVRQRLNLHNRFTRTQTSSLVTREELTRLADCVDLLIPNAPKQDVNAWKLTRDDVSFYLLGTFHYTRLWKMRSVETLIRFLTTTPFTSVFTELREDYSRSLPLPEAAKLERYRLADEDFHKIPDDETNAKKKKIALVRLANLKSQNGVEAWDQPLDNAFLSLVLSSHRDTLDPSNEAHYSALETVETRIDAHKQNAKDNTPTDSVPNQDQDGSIDPVEAGNQQAIFIDALNDMRAGLDKASCVERNKQWVSKVTPAKGQLWIVGASHVPGLICHFLLEHGFTAEPVV